MDLLRFGLRCFLLWLLGLLGLLGWLLLGIWSTENE